MMNKGLILVTKVAAIVSLFLGVIACEKINCDEPAPSLEHDTLRLNEARDSLLFVVSFEDCQGDIGHFGQVDSNTVRSVRTFMYEQINGAWERWRPINPADSVSFFSVIPGSVKNREGWLLKGKVEQKFGLSNLRQNSDTIRFETYIIDQAENKSNTVVSPTFVFPEAFQPN
jgi:hypothetical protein